MKYLIKNSLRPAYKFLRNRNQREFYRIYSKLSRVDRFHKICDFKFLSYVFDIPDSASFIWQFKEIFVDNVYKFDSYDDEPLIYDCGANVGLSCLYFKCRFPKAKIKAFEADPDISKILKSNLSRNNIQNIEIFDQAVWVDDDGVKFNSDGADGGSVVSSEKSITVNSVRLRELIACESKIDLLKIDIEGAEFDVLRDCREFLGNVDNIFVEYHSRNGSAQRLSEILGFLQNAGFRYYIESVSKRNCPFINHGTDIAMDLQLNIYGYKRY